MNQTTQHHHGRHSHSHFGEGRHHGEGRNFDRPQRPQPFWTQGGGGPMWHGRGDGPGRHGGGPGRGPGGRMRRGDARYIFLDALRDGPRHGYEIIKSLEERSGGQYSPSPGTVYPTLQYLQEAGLVAADQESDRRVYRLTEAGRVELEARAAEIVAFWESLASHIPTAAQETELGFLRSEMEEVARTIWGGVHGPRGPVTTETLRAIRQALEKSKNEIRDIIAASQTAPTDEA